MTYLQKKVDRGASLIELSNVKNEYQELENGGDIRRFSTARFRHSDTCILLLRRYKTNQLINKFCLLQFLSLANETWKAIRTKTKASCKLEFYIYNQILIDEMLKCNHTIYKLSTATYSFKSLLQFAAIHYHRQKNAW